MSAYMQLAYLGIFMTLVLILYFIFPKKYRYFVLLLASIIMIFTVSSFMGIFVILSSLVIYLIGIWINKINKDALLKKPDMSKDEWKAYKKVIKKKVHKVLVLGVILNLGMLLGIKYLNFFDQIINSIFSLCKLNVSIPFLKIIMPLGISYYTLNGIGYMIDVARGKYEGSKNFFEVLLYICYFPCLLEGPFNHFDNLSKQLTAPNTFSFDNFVKGLMLIIFGLFKKIVIADRVAILVSYAFDPKNAPLTGISMVLSVLAFTLQLYAEFSGIIDMVTGVSLLFGIKLEKNFEQPFFSTSVGEFWRRWHISLGVWFKEYIFYPMSVSKPMMGLCKKLRGKVSPFFETFIPSIFVLLVVWSLTGLWHGASFKYLVYGLYYYVIMMFESLFAYLLRKTNYNTNKYIKPLLILKTFIFINIGMLIFRADNLQVFGTMFVNMFKANNFNILTVLNLNELIIVIIGTIFIFIISLLKERGISIRESILKMPLALQYALVLALIFSIIVFGAYGQGYLPPDPIYGGF